MQAVMNLKIKYRESFRPFAPPVREALRSPNGHARANDLRSWVNEVRSTVPAITHVDYSARVQTVDRETSPRYHAILQAFDELTGCPVVINTSFNVRGEPIVCTP